MYIFQSKVSCEYQEQKETEHQGSLEAMVTKKLTLNMAKSEET